MSTASIVGITVGVVLIGSVAAFLILRRKRSQQASRVCGGCERVMLPEWDRCLFCGWVPVPRLEFISGPLAGHVMPLTEEVTTVGSVAGNTIVLSDPAVSRKHLGIRRVSSVYEFADLGSTNGVYINGHRMPKKVLESGDLLRVGNTEMVFRRD